MVKKVAEANGKKDSKTTTSTRTAVARVVATAKRAYLSQLDVPAYSLNQAIRIARAIAEHYAYKPTSPLNVAAALDMLPGSSHFRQLTGASIAYGLTKGAASADEISIEPLGLRVVRPTREGEDQEARREALLRPRVVGDFLQQYNGAQLPREDIARNVLIDLGVPPDRAAEVLGLILEGAESVGFLKTIKDKRYVDLSGASDDSASSEPPQDQSDDIVGGKGISERAALAVTATPPSRLAAPGAMTPPDRLLRRVFIVHGKNRQFLDPIKKLLGFGNFEPVVSVERPSVAQPLPEKVFNEMRSCGAAIIHVDAELALTDIAGKEHLVLNSNVLLEIGASIAMYGRRFILLVRDGIVLPSDLQGLFEVRYKGEVLDSDATIRLLETINDLKNHPLPDRYPKELPVG